MSERVVVEPRIQPKAQGSILLESDEPVIRTANPEEEAGFDVADIHEYDEENGDVRDEDGALPVPTKKSTKVEILHWLMFDQGIDPDDLQNLTKAELLELAHDLS